MENLLALLDKIQHVSPLPFFSSETIIVQNAGMQHWLNLSLAKNRGISMNIHYALPAQYLWKLIRTLVSEGEVPDQSPYSREVLTWRIHSLLATKTITSDQIFDEVNQYWQAEQYSEDQAQLKRYQLAHQVADLYEQYLIFRPDWINDWSNNKNDPTIFQGESQPAALWQSKLWALLNEQQAYNPQHLINDALANIKDKLHLLPKRLSFFGINAMAPMWLSFIHKISSVIDVHFFHLNPCVDYWGDIASEKQIMRKISHWTEEYANESYFVGNPLLASLGQQGREFVAMLQEVSTVDIEVFDNIDSETNSAPTMSILNKVQHDILTLTNPSQLMSVSGKNSDLNGEKNDGSKQYADDSITITSCHSALREVQGLHDWLLHQFNQDSSLTPKDIIVMCPQIENYAPYIDAVFTRGWQELNDSVPPLPCSIADRVSKDADPIISAFLDVITLPDSRFQVSQLVTFLRIPAMQRKFSISLDELEKITLWLEQSAIHWGLNSAHKASLLQTNNQHNSFTWQQGLSRLLRGFAFGDSSVIFQGMSLLPTIEGNDAQLLGKLMLVIERLQTFSKSLAMPRNACNWQTFLFSLLEGLFDIKDETSFADINKAIESVAEHCMQAKYDEKIPLSIISDFLNNHFSQPEPGRQFMIGQVTFCSMVPMRSIPFKIVAILGLNDGEFPRQKQPLGFDLLAVTPARLGDRSRRGDDRYLFLEAIISARQTLYLSFQGNNIKNNAAKQPSIVLKEFIEYLTLSYGFGKGSSNKQQNDQNNNAIRTLAMQPFSELNYQGDYPSFDDKWLKLTQPSSHAATYYTEEENVDTQSLVILNPSVAECNDNSESNSQQLTIDIQELISFFQHPSKYFAKHQLNLNLTVNDVELSDVEPFEIDQLSSYLLRQALLNVELENRQTEQANNKDDNDLCDDKSVNEINDKRSSEVLTQAHLSGKFPDSPSTELTFERWQQDANTFSQLINQNCPQSPEMVNIELNHQFKNEEGSFEFTLTAQLPVNESSLTFYRSSSAKSKDKFTLYIHQLVSQVLQQNDQALKHINEAKDESINLQNIDSTTGFYFDTKSQKATKFVVQNIPDADEKLSDLVALFVKGRQQPLLLNTDLAEKINKSKAFTQQSLETYWSDENSFIPFGEDPYIAYFWPNCPDYLQYQTLLEQTYLPLYETVLPMKLAININREAL